MSDSHQAAGADTLAAYDAMDIRLATSSADETPGDKRAYNPSTHFDLAAAISEQHMKGSPACQAIQNAALQFADEARQLRLLLEREEGSASKPREPSCCPCGSRSMELQMELFDRHGKLVFDSPHPQVSKVHYSTKTHSTYVTFEPIECRRNETFSRVIPLHCLDKAIDIHVRIKADGSVEQGYVKVLMKAAHSHREVEVETETEAIDKYMDNEPMGGLIALPVYGSARLSMTSMIKAELRHEKVAGLGVYILKAEVISYSRLCYEVLLGFAAGLVLLVILAVVIGLVFNVAGFLLLRLFGIPRAPVVAPSP